MGLGTIKVAGSGGSGMKARGIGGAAAIALAALAALLPAPAGAALPKPKNDLIVPAKSIGGLALGAPHGGVTSAWGANSACTEISCIYSAPTQPEEDPAFAGALLDKGAKGFKVWQLYIHVGETLQSGKSKPDFDTPLTAFKTSKGIGLGSSGTEVERAYPAAQKIGGSGGSTYTLKGAGESATIFSTAASGKVMSIVVEAHPGG